MFSCGLVLIDLDLGMPLNGNPSNTFFYTLPILSIWPPRHFVTNSITMLLCPATYFRHLNYAQQLQLCFYHSQPSTQPIRYKGENSGCSYYESFICWVYCILFPAIKKGELERLCNVKRPNRNNLRVHYEYRKAVASRCTWGPLDKIILDVETGLTWTRG